MNKILSCELVKETTKSRRPRRRAQETEEKKLARARRAVDYMVPQYAEDYMNMVVARGLATGNGNKMNEDWIRRFLDQNIEDGFVTEAEAETLKDTYKKVIEELKTNF